MKNDERLQQYRYFLKDSIRKEVDFSQTDQLLGVPVPPVQKPCAESARRIALPQSFKMEGNVSLFDAIRNRRSVRRFTQEPLSQAELSLLLWATQGIDNPESPYFRTVPSAGARHAFETYVCVHRVSDLEKGVYRYLPLEHQLVLEHQMPDLERQVTIACLGQEFAGKAAATFLWTTIPYRMEWRYGLASYKVIALDAGHVCQNLYLACEAIGCGTCAIAAYDQRLCDELVGVDGEDEFTVYVAPVGKKIIR